MSAQKENAKVIAFPNTHPVYNSIMEVFSSVSKIGNFEFSSVQHDSNNSIQILKSSTNYFQYTRQDFDKANIYVLQSPLLALGTWEALIKKIPFVGTSEYMENRTHKDAIATALFSNFKKIPFVVQTRRAKRFLERCGVNPVFLIPPAEKKRQGDKERKHILFVGKLIESKNVCLLLKIAKHFKDEKFIIIGKGPLLGTVTEEAKHLRNVEIIPFLKNRDALFEYYSQAKLLIHTAIKDPIGFVVIEALSTQTPTLVSSGTGASDYLPPDWVADPKNEAEWILKVGQILKNKNSSIRKAEQIFIEEHLDIDDPFFEKSAELIYQAICSRWPHLARARD